MTEPTVVHVTTSESDRLPGFIESFISSEKPVYHNATVTLSDGSVGEASVRSSSGSEADAIREATDHARGNY